MKDDPYDLQRFMAPHAADTYDRAAAELQCGGLRCLSLIHI